MAESVPRGTRASQDGERQWAESGAEGGRLLGYLRDVKEGTVQMSRGKRQIERLMHTQAPSGKGLSVMLVW